MIQLTQQERDKFADWLEQDAKGDDLLAKRLHGKIVSDMLRKKVVAKMIVARELRRIESVSVSDGQQQEQTSVENPIWMQWAAERVASKLDVADSNIHKIEMCIAEAYDEWIKRDAELDALDDEMRKV